MQTEAELVAEKLGYKYYFRIGNIKNIKINLSYRLFQNKYLYLWFC